MSIPRTIVLFALAGTALFAQDEGIAEVEECRVDILMSPPHLPPQADVIRPSLTMLFLHLKSQNLCPISVARLNKNVLRVYFPKYHKRQTTLSAVSECSRVQFRLVSLNSAGLQYPVCTPTTQWIEDAREPGMKHLVEACKGSGFSGKVAHSGPFFRSDANEDVPTRGGVTEHDVYNFTKNNVDRKLAIISEGRVLGLFPIERPIVGCEFFPTICSCLGMSEKQLYDQCSATYSSEVGVFIPGEAHWEFKARARTYWGAYTR